MEHVCVINSSQSFQAINLKLCTQAFFMLLETTRNSKMIDLRHTKQKKYIRHPSFFFFFFFFFHAVRDQCDLTAHPGVQFGIFKLAKNRIEEFVLLCLIYILYKQIM